MKKLFISVPMRNRTEYAIKASMEQMHKIAEAVFGEELEVIPTYFEDDPPENTNMALWYLGESIKKLSEADRFIGMVVILASDISQVSKGLIRMNDVWDKIGRFLGHMLAMTIVICAWLIIITVTLKVIWFTLFRILL